MQPDRLREEVVRKYAEHINPYLAKLMNFAGFGVEIKGEGCYLFDQDGKKYLDCLGGYGVFSLGNTVPFILKHSPCPVLLLRGKNGAVPS